MRRAISRDKSRRSRLGATRDNLFLKIVWNKDASKAGLEPDRGWKFGRALELEMMREKQESGRRS